MQTQTSQPIPSTETLLREKALLRKIAFRLLPFLFLLYIVAYLDRVNVGFAKLQMNNLPWFNDSVFGTAAGIFFIGYFLFEVPSNLLLQRFGARRWIMRIMISWGIVAMAMLFASSERTFYALRFALGLAEAGFFPGVLLYLTYWFTAKERARVVAFFMTANAVAYIFGGPISGLILSLPTTLGLASWQQLFLIEGFPAILLGIVVLYYLPDTPASSTFLTEEEKTLLAQRMQNEDFGNRTERSVMQALTQPAVYILCGVFFLLVTGMYGISLWMPQIIKSFGKLSDLQVGLLTAIPYTTAAIVMVANGFHSDATQERQWHICIPALLGASGLVGCALFTNPVLQIAALSVAASGLWAILGPFWSLPPATLRIGGSAALAGGLAAINSVGNLGGFIGPFVVGRINDSTHDYKAGLFFLATSAALGGLLALTIRVPRSAAENLPDFSALTDDP